MTRLIGPAIFLFLIATGFGTGLPSAPSPSLSPKTGVLASGHIGGSPHATPVSGRSLPSITSQGSGLSVSMDQFPPVPFADSAIIYTVTLTNDGPGTAGSVLLSDPLPDQVFLFDCSSTSGGVCSDAGNLITVSFNSLAEGQSAVVSIEVVVDCTVATGATISNSVTATCGSCSSSEPQSASLSATVFHQPPFVSCPDDITVNAPAGQSSAQVTYASPTVRDKCQIASQNCSPASGSEFPVGVTKVSCTATDVSGATGTCSFNVTVGPPGPFITGVTITGKKLVVSGSSFDLASTIEVNGRQEKTTVIVTDSQIVLSSKKAARQIAPGQTVLVQVKNSSGILSNQFTYVRPD
ncbi:MAG TPA: HYR domain-containing protein [Blastocatellia bacterium]|nr:HYR domain-containing protein [Blastocatellia bacterium]